MRFLCASNLHLGRRLAGLPDHAGIDPGRLSAGATWSRLCHAAVTYNADAVLLAGDVIDRENGFFEPAGALQQGLGVLEREGIPVIMIAGDEDFETLPRAVEMLASPVVTLLGPDRPAIDIGAGGDRATVIGLSQQDATGLRNVLASLPDVHTEHPTVVILHAAVTDGNAPPGTFQPVQIDDLAASPTDVWILGAQREPDILVLDDTTVIEPGATLPLDPAETGIHGATLVELFDEGGAVCELIPLSPVQFADIDLELSGTEDLEAVESAIVRALYDTLDDAISTNVVASLATVPCTVHLTGATPLHAELPSFMEELSRTLAVTHQGVSAALHACEIDTRPQVELDSLLGRPDPVGELARLLRTLDDDGETTPAQEALVQRTIDRLVGVHRSRVFAGVASDPAPDEEMARTILRREAWSVLDALVRQRGVDA
jgi:DNA repair protein SbcD/Mre11